VPTTFFHPLSRRRTTWFGEVNPLSSISASSALRVSERFEALPKEGVAKAIGHVVAGSGRACTCGMRGVSAIAARDRLWFAESARVLIYIYSIMSVCMNVYTSGQGAVARSWPMCFQQHTEAFCFVFHAGMTNSSKQGYEQDSTRPQHRAQVAAVGLYSPTCCTLPRRERMGEALVLARRPRLGKTFAARQ